MNDLFFMAMWHRRKVLALFMIAAIGVGGLATWLLPRQYTVNNGFRIGQFMGVPLEQPEFTRQRFRQVGFIADAYEAKDLLLAMPRDRYPKTVKVSIENDFNKQSNIDTVVFSTTAETPELALAMNEALAAHLVRVHSAKLEEAKALRRREIADWEAGIAKTTGDLEVMENRLAQLGSGQKLGEAAIFLTTAKLEEQQSLLFHMREKIHHVNLKIDNPVESFTTEIISSPRLPERPSFPSVPLLLAGLLCLSFPAWLFYCWTAAQISHVLAAREKAPPGKGPRLVNKSLVGE